MIWGYLIPILALARLRVYSQYCPLPNDFSYHDSTPPTIRSFQGIYHSNYNETIGWALHTGSIGAYAMGRATVNLHLIRTFCNFKAKSFELNSWSIIPVLAQTAYGHPPYTTVGAVLTGGTYIASNGSIVWHGFGFSASGPYNCAFSLSMNGSTAEGYYTYVDQKNGSNPAGETAPWLLQYQREPTWGECALVHRGYTAKDYETGCTASGD